LYLKTQDHPFIYMMWAIVNILVWQEFGMSGLGEYFFTISIFTVIVFALSLGLNRRIRHQTNLTRQDIREWLGNSLFSGIVWGGICFILIYFAIFFYHKSIFPIVQKELLLIGALSIIPICTSMYCAEILSRFKRHRRINLTLIFRGLLLLAALIFIIHNNVLTLQLAISIWVIVEVLMAVSMMWRVLKQAGFSFSLNIRKLLAEIYGGFFSHLIELFLWLLRFVDVILLAILSSYFELGQYVFAILTVGIVWRLPELFTRASPHNVEPMADQNRITKSLRIAFTVSSLTAFIFLLTGWLLSTLVYGSEFDKIYLLYLHLIPGAVVLSQFRVLILLHMPRSSSKILMILLMSALGLNIGTSIVLIPHWGANGAAFAFSISHLFMGGILISNYRRLLKLGWSDLYILRVGEFKWKNFFRMSNT